MAEIVIHSANKHGTKELTSGDLVVSFHVDRTRVKEVLPLYLIDQDQPLDITISDGKSIPKKEKSSEQKRRESLYAQIQVRADELGYSEEKMRAVFVKITSHESRKDMTEKQLEEVEKHFYNEANPTPGIM